MNDATIKIPAELFAPAESSHFEGELDIPMLAAGPDEYRFNAPIVWDAEVTNTGDALLIMGKASGIAATQCARCLDDVEYDLEGDIEGYFLINDESAAPDDMEDDEFDVLPESHIVDMTPLICAALLVDVPEPPLCSDDCRGLCPQCGANLNDGDCGCVDEEAGAFEEAKNPFAVLKGLTFDNGSDEAGTAVSGDWIPEAPGLDDDCELGSDPDREI